MKTKKTKRKDFAKLHKNQGALFSEVKNDLETSSLQSDSSDSTINYNTKKNEKLRKLNQKFECVTLKIEELEIKKDELIALGKSVSNLEDRIYGLEDKQFEIQEKIEELECD